MGARRTNICEAQGSNRLSYSWQPADLALLAVNLLLLYIWVKVVNPPWVRTVADAYSYRLLGATEILVDNR